jgi:PKHD-type hydroxylase
MAESMQFTQYSISQHYQWHADQRLKTLSEVRQIGTAVIFPSHLYHRVTPVTAGTRRSLVAWFVGPPFV